MWNFSRMQNKPRMTWAEYAKYRQDLRRKSCLPTYQTDALPQLYSSLIKANLYSSQYLIV